MFQNQQIFSFTWVEKFLQMVATAVGGMQCDKSKAFPAGKECGVVDGKWFNRGTLEEPLCSSKDLELV